MCWISYTKPTKQIAKQDIIVYKVIQPSSRDRVRSFLYCTKESPDGGITTTLYKLGQVYQATDAYDNKISTLEVITGTKYAIHEGFHSYVEKPHILHLYHNLLSLVKCIIPKGTEYYTNNSECVSTHIKFISIL